MPTTQLTRSEVESNAYIRAEVERQALYIRQDIARIGEVWWAGNGYHRDLSTFRDFALRVLIAKKELERDPADRRRFVAVSA